MLLGWIEVMVLVEQGVPLGQTEGCDQTVDSLADGMTE